LVLGALCVVGNQLPKPASRHRPAINPTGMAGR
jgi:hypothetical protein